MALCRKGEGIWGFIEGDGESYPFSTHRSRIAVGKKYFKYLATMPESAGVAGYPTDGF
jgi:hypothetical protein